jgi:cyclic-di-GMP-binding biofilm dispersal mediator protein
MEFANKRILVVGASGALGATITSQLIAKGATVLGTARSNDSAGKIPKAVEVRLLLDYENKDSIKTLTDYLNSTTELDGIVNAAGVVAFGKAVDTPADVISTMMQTNAIGPMQLIAELQPVLLASAQRGGEPFVVNLTGVVAELPMANMAGYSASKTAIAGYLQALGKEWRREGIRVLSVTPGHTETGLATRAISGEAPAFPQGMTSEHVASVVLDALANDLKELPASAF